MWMQEMQIKTLKWKPPNNDNSSPISFHEDSLLFLYFLNLYWYHFGQFNSQVEQFRCMYNFLKSKVTWIFSRLYTVVWESSKISEDATQAFPSSGVDSYPSDPRSYQHINLERSKGSSMTSPNKDNDKIMIKIMLTYVQFPKIKCNLNIF